MDYLAGVPGLGRRSVGRLLEALNDLRLKSGQLGPSARPLLGLHLRGGAVLEGWLLELGPSEGGGETEPMVLLHRATPNPQQPAEAVAYVPLHEIQALTVFEAVAAGRHLLPPVTELELRRMTEQIGQALSARAGKAVSAQLVLEEVPESAFVLVSEQLKALAGGIADLLGDPLAVTALSGRVNTLSIQVGSFNAGAFLHGSTLRLKLSSTHPSGREGWKTMVQGVL